jgi:hypothetical protein
MAATRESERRAGVEPQRGPSVARCGDRGAERDWARSFAALSLRLRSQFSRASAVRRGAELFLSPARRALGRRGKEALAAARREWLPFAGRHFPFWIWDGASYRPPTVLLIHDWGGRAADLAAFVAPLRREGARVVAFDAPAHGEASGHQTDIVEFAATVAAMLRRHSEWAPPRGLVAHGFGALAATLAVATGARAERLVFLAAVESLDPYLEQFRRETGLGEPLLEAIRVDVERRVGRTFDSVRGGRAACALNRPLLAIHDADDAEVAWEHSRRLVDRWTHSRLQRTFGLGHRGLLDHGDVVTAAVEHLFPESAPGADR